MFNRIETNIAKVVSVVLHPLLMPTYTIIILFNLQAYFSLIIPIKAKWFIGSMVFLTTGLLPLLFTFIMTRTGLVRNLLMNQREERLWPFMVTALFYYLAYYLLGQLEISAVYSFFMLGAFVSLVIGLIVSFFWKISAHMIGMGGITGAFIGLSFTMIIDMPMLIIILILMSGVAGFARLKLSAHNPAQIFFGYLTGFGILLAILLNA
ncbi:MAG TPA: hypothetical protein PK908_00990 [Bacteroidales bacterium]|nr:hypothetical protein [Bacteroidales bacterium]